jgi:hypothetical protein
MLSGLRGLAHRGKEIGLWNEDFTEFLRGSWD